MIHCDVKINQQKPLKKKKREFFFFSPLSSESSAGSLWWGAGQREVMRSLWVREGIPQGSQRLAGGEDGLVGKL